MDLSRDRTGAFEMRDRLLTSLKAEINVHYVWWFVSYLKENRMCFAGRNLSVNASYQIIGVCCEKYRMLLNTPLGKCKARNFKHICTFAKYKPLKG